MTKYEKSKDNARADASYYFFNRNDPCYWSDREDAKEYFKKLGKRYGLLREFRENGII